MIFRRARAEDLAAILSLLVDDTLGASRDSGGGDLAPYHAAFAQIDADPHQLLAVSEDAGRIVGTLQLTFIPGLSRGGALRGQIEAVRVASDMRGRGIGAAMIAWAVEECRRRGCALVQLTTDRSRTEAHRFYDRLGFEASHLGYKMALR